MVAKRLGAEWLRGWVLLCLALSCSADNSQNIWAPGVFIPSTDRYDAAELSAGIQTMKSRAFYLLTNSTWERGLDDLNSELDANFVSWYSSWGVNSITDGFDTDLYNSDEAYEVHTFQGAKFVRNNLNRFHRLAMQHAMRDDRDTVGGKNIPDKEYLREILVNASIQLAKRGVNETYFEPGIEDSQWSQWGSFFYGIDKDNKEPTPFGTRMENYLGPAVFLIQDILAEAGTLSGVQGGLKTLTRRWEHGIYFLNDTTYFPEPNVNTDQSRVLLFERLLYILSLDTAGDSSGTQAQHMDAWWRWTTKALATDDTTSYAFKPDGTIHHHMMIYANGYGYDTLQLAAFAAWVAAGTPWALRKAEVDNVARATSVLQVFSAQRSTPRSVGGRLYPDHDAVKAGHLCAAALLADMDEDAISEDFKILAKASLVHWVEDIRDQDSAYLTDCCTHKQQQYLGCVRLREKLLASNTDEIEQSLMEHDLPSMSKAGAFHYPYAGMSVFRPANGWVAVAKGYSRVVKNTFEYSWDDENLHGYYQGAGTLFLMSEDGWEASGFEVTRATKPETAYSGFDWFRMPGATTPHRSPDPDAYTRNGNTLYPKRDYDGDGGFDENGVWTGGDSNGIQWPDHPDAFVGGVLGSKVSNIRGVFGFRMEDMVSNYLEGSLHAYKSNFFIASGDGMHHAIVALGSGITSNESDAGVVETTLFQTYIPSGDAEDYPTSVDGQSETVIPYSASWNQMDDDPMVRVIDTVGNGFIVVPRGEGNMLHVVRQSQTNPTDESYTTMSVGDYSVGTIDHGRAPKNASYEYVVITNTTMQELAEVDPKDLYDVLVLTEDMHAIKDKITNSVGLVSFRESETNDAVLAATHITHISTACSMTVTPAKSGYTVTLANPDLGFLDDDERFNSYSSTARMLYRRESRPMTTQVELQGEWRVVESSIGQADSLLGASSIHPIIVNRSFAMDTTTLSISSGDGVSVEFNLCPGGDGESDCTSCLNWRNEECDSTFDRPQCEETRSWEDLIPLVEQGMVVTGGLGRLMEPGRFHVWTCFKNHPCAPAEDWMCYVYGEASGEWLTWGLNSQLQLC